ncbi:hypothetical protein B296_00018580 [Ensete ventricosum]|uniref:Uncharacterized protein n=1 Tax=Ensete ventricosum TaxID=4639 RepID=A0A427ACX1_ENSVE|nr:hypothetical protein B296_00018580 [Ensete ventricosum]
MARPIAAKQRKKKGNRVMGLCFDRSNRQRLEEESCDPDLLVGSGKQQERMRDWRPQVPRLLYRWRGRRPGWEPCRFRWRSNPTRRSDHGNDDLSQLVLVGNLEAVGAAAVFPCLLT